VDIVIFELTADHSGELSRMLLSGRPEYSQHFTPFSSYEADDLAKWLETAQRDRYWGIRCGEELAGFFMLRGFDEGYERPSFGVYIAKRFANRGLSKLALQYALSWCQLNKVSAVMLKVHPENTYARRVYEQAGFKFIEVCPETGHDMFEKRWD
jgi:RimJ/RimL family protein N-acetyltransferase